MATTFLIILTLFCFLHATSTNTVLNEAVNALTTSGYNSMALTLEFGSRSIIIPPSPATLTIFCPSDAVFTKSGQPSLNLLQFHFSPLSFSLHSLKSLPSGSKIPTLWANHSLTVSSLGDNDKIEVNGVKINGLPVYDNGNLMILGIDKFLDPNFQVLDSIKPPPRPFHDCPVLGGKGDGHIDSNHSYIEASEVLRSRSYSIMASFLDLQLADFKDQMTLTIFAPTDGSVKGLLGNIREYRSIFLRHFVPCKISMTDLAGTEVGSLYTYLDGFLINVSKNGRNIILNGVKVIAPEIYNNSWLVVHGLGGSLLQEDDSKSNCANARNDYMFLTVFTLLVSLWMACFYTPMCWIAYALLVLLGLLTRKI